MEYENDGHFIKLELAIDLPRTTTRQEYKAISRWLRSARKHCEEKMKDIGLLDLLYLAGKMKKGR
ncbi:MAG: hypothetical protein PHQ00_04955 [Phycisphaerae bacterium]|nr:hypothetical protein [Phycisphaerae bacterium]